MPVRYLILPVILPVQALRPGLLGWTAYDGGDSSGVVERLDAQSLALLLHSLSQLDFLPADWWLEEYLKVSLFGQ